MNEKPTVTKTYQLTANESQTLKFETADIGKTILSKSVYVKSKNSNTPTIWTNWESIPTFTSFDPNNLNVQMSGGMDFDDYDYVMISVDLGEKIYYFYIYSVKNNVYESSGSEPITFVPGDLDTIRKQSELSSDDSEMHGFRKYTYLYTDSEGKTCELRYSIHSYTGLGYSGDSFGKWFMKRDGKYYRLESDGWKPFHNENNKNALNMTDTYWKLSGKNKIDELGKGQISNTTFWQYWNQPSS